MLALDRPSRRPRWLFRSSSFVASAVTALTILTVGGAVLTVSPGDARADDADGVTVEKPRGRPCCALAEDMAINLASTHVPVVLGGVLPAHGIGHHSYLRAGSNTENNGFVYTRRGGFIDLGHTRDNADIAAYLSLRLRPMLRRGEGVIDFGPKGADRRIRVTRAVPEAELARTSDLLAVRIAFQMSIWTELVQYYGLTKFAGAEEVYSSFTPDDLYSNLLGAHLGITALESDVPYDHAMDVALHTTLDSLGVVSKAETRRTLDRLAGSWWSPDFAWPSRDIAILRTYGIGPEVAPSLAPEEVIASHGKPLVLDVPESGPGGALLADDYKLEIVPHENEMARFPAVEKGKTFDQQDLPRLVEEVHAAFDADEAKAKNGEAPETEAGVRGEVAHYLTGIRLFELSGEGGGHGSGDDTTGVGGGHVLLLRGDTRGGDFAILRMDAMHSAERGTMAGVSFFRSDALWFCHDPETGGIRPPLVSLLGPCGPGEWLGMSGALGEALHDGGTGRTALRPVALSGVLNPLRNGQSASYDARRLLLHVGGEVEHIWTEEGGARTLPRATSSLSFLLRNASRHLEARGDVGYRLDVAKPRDGVFESDLKLAYNFLLGGRTVTTSRDHQERLDPWALASIGVEGSYSYFARPANAYPEIAAPYVSTDRPGAYQVLLTGTIGLEALSF